MEHIDLFKYTERFNKEFACAQTFNTFVDMLDASKPGPAQLLQHIAQKYPGVWDASYLTIKKHGFTAKPLLLPEATKATDIFEHVGLYSYQTGCYRREIKYIAAGAAFVNGLSAPGFAYFGRLGASYTRNNKPYISGGREVVTAAKPTHIVKNVYAPAGPDEWDLATFEAIQWEDKHTLITVHATNGFAKHWLCILAPGESALSLLSHNEKTEIDKEMKVKDSAVKYLLQNCSK